MKPALLVTLTWLSACSGDTELAELHEFIREVEPAAQLAAPIPVMTRQHFTYAAAELRSPFAASSHASPSAVQSPIEQLETFRLAELSLVGTLNNAHRRVALVEDRDGGVHQVRAGDYLGNQRGQVTGITDTRITIKETEADGQGGWLEKQTQLEFTDSATPEE